ncbi:PA2928 family protein [Phenylobacterium sp.]|uniref:PA2928 family protein n=1 Tax=Phenylobacterium sp. TaxID=1871053 RepID=UPI0025FD9AF0|nr:PA2928 family protein [Phenylobacterium sp.]
MREPTVTWRRRNFLRALPGRLRVALAILVVPLVIAGVVWFFVAGGGLVPSAADVQGEPVRTATADGDRVFLMTSQWRTYRTRGTRTGTSYTKLLVDVWGFDAATARPVWRQRIADDRGGVNMGRKILGVQGGVLWLLDGKGLLGLSPRDGAEVADNATLEAANPALRGVMPIEDRYYRFDPQGLSFTAADGRDWRLTGQGSATVPDGPRLDLDAQRAPARPGISIPANTAGGIGTWAFYTRGLNINGKMWLGLLAEPEVAAFREQGVIGGVDPARYPRARVWSARIGSKPTFFGPKATFTDFKPLPEGPEFLTAGLLEDNRCCHRTPILLFKPDSVLVLHRDRLGAAGRLKLTRVSGPLGRPLWTVELPATELEAVMPGETSLVLLGRRDEPPLFPRRDSRPESIDQLVSIDLRTGALGAYGFRIRPTASHDLPASSTNP